MKQTVIERVLEPGRLPTLPAVALQIIELVHQQNVNIRQLAETVSQDPALVGKILKTVNSSFYARTHPISTVSHALVVLGLNTFKALALGFSLIPCLRSAGGEGFDHDAFWMRSTLTATAARCVAKQAGILQQEEAFLCGLLQDIGVLSMSQTLGAEYRDIILRAGGNHRTLCELERQRFDIDHALVGAALANHWQLPAVLVEPIKYHENPEGAEEEMVVLVRCVALAARAADVCTNPGDGEAMASFCDLAKEWFGFTPDQAESLLATTLNTSREASQLMELPEARGFDAAHILALAHEALMGLNLRREHSTGATPSKLQIPELSITDTLTGVANSRRLGEYLEQQFEMTQQGGRPLSLIVVRIDKFSAIIDKHGTATSDRALIQVAAALKSSSPATSMVARLGIDQFAVVLHGTQRDAATRYAETLRQAVEAIRMDDESSQPLRVTASLGVATFDGSGFTRASQLLNAADQGATMAREAGGNGVRVFLPKTGPAEQRAIQSH